MVKVKAPRIKNEAFMRMISVPLAADYVEIVCDQAEWQQLVWGEESLMLNLPSGQLTLSPLSNFTFRQVKTI